MSSGVPSILGLRGAGILRLRLQLRRSGPVVGVAASRGVASRLLGRSQVSLNEAEDRGQGRGPRRPLAIEPGYYSIGAGARAPRTLKPTGLAGWRARA